MSARSPGPKRAVHLSWRLRSPDVQALHPLGCQLVDAVSVQDGSRSSENSSGAFVVLCGQVPSGGPPERPGRASGGA